MSRHPPQLLTQESTTASRLGSPGERELLAPLAGAESLLSTKHSDERTLQRSEMDPGSIEEFEIIKSSVSRCNVIPPDFQYLFSS